MIIVTSFIAVIVIRVIGLYRRQDKKFGSSSDDPNDAPDDNGAPSVYHYPKHVDDRGDNRTHTDYDPPSIGSITFRDRSPD